MDSLAGAIGKIMEKAPQEVKKNLATISHQRWTEEAKAELLNATIPANPISQCPVCKGRGYIANVDAMGVLCASPCKCIATRAETERMRHSGLSGVYNRYRLDNYRVESNWQAEALRKAKGFIGNPQGWFVLSGRSGSGKTHLATAVCRELIARNHSVAYLAWRSEAPKLKGCISDYKQYATEIGRWKNAEILYIDDLLKSRTTTDADISLTFELLSHRDMCNLPTIISSELTIDQICELDEAVGSRIAAQSRTLYIVTGGVNYRLQGG